MKVGRIPLLFTKIIMSRVCQITGARSSVGNNRSHAMNATKRKFNPNLIKKKVYDPKTGRMRKMKVSVAALRTMVKRASK